MNDMITEATLKAKRARRDAEQTAGNAAGANLHQTSETGSEPNKPKRRSLLEQAIVGDLVVVSDAAAITAIEQVRDEVDGPMIVERWKDQGLVDGKDRIEVWELRAGGYYRRRRAGR